MFDESIVNATNHRFSGHTKFCCFHGHNHHCMYTFHNLGICAISRLRCAFSESGNCVPISRLHSQS